MYLKLWRWIYRQYLKLAFRKCAFGKTLHLTMQHGGTPPNLTVKWKRISIIAYLVDEFKVFVHNTGHPDIQTTTSYALSVGGTWAIWYTSG